MKRLSIKLAFLLCFGFEVSAQSNAEKVTAHFDSIIDFEGTQINQIQPIADLNRLASQQADTILFLTKNNIESVFKVAEQYTKSIISVERHTIVSIDSWDDCKESGAWNCKVPKGVGYIQRDNNLSEYNDYINYIIGLPNSERRAVFLFK